MPASRSKEWGYKSSYTPHHLQLVLGTSSIAGVHKQPNEYVGCGQANLIFEVLEEWSRNQGTHVLYFYWLLLKLLNLVYDACVHKGQFASDTQE